MKESTFSTTIKKALARSQYPTWTFKVHGEAMQVRGVPDLVIVAEQGTLWVELKALDIPKRPDTWVLRPRDPFTKLQVETMLRIQRAGGRAFGLIHIGSRVFKISATSLRWIEENKATCTYDELLKQCRWFAWPITNDVNSFVRWLYNFRPGIPRSSTWESSNY